MKETKTVAFALSVILFGVSNLNGAFAEGSVDLKKVARGNPLEINRAFDERARSDGAAFEEIDIAIGETIRKNPKAFLEAYRAHQPIIRLDSLVGNLGPDFVDEFKKQEIEVKGRISVLKKVKEPSLQPAAKACIAELERLQKMIQGILKVKH